MASMRELLVVILFQDSIITDVLESFVHPTAPAVVVFFVAIDELLDRVLRQILLFTRNVSEALHRGSRAESPACSTPILVVWLSNMTLFIPVFMVRDVKTLSF